MMSLSRIFLPLGITQALLGLASAVTFNLAGDWLADENGIQGIPNGSLIMLIASTEDGAFSPPSEEGLVDPLSDDVVLGTFAASDDNGKANKGSYAVTIQANFGDAANGLEAFDGGDPLLIRWFPTLKTADLESIGSGAVPYGEFRTDEVLLGSNATWITPGSNSATINLSIVAGSIGNRYNPLGSLSVEELAAESIVELAILEAVQAHLTISVLTNGSLSLTWPLLKGADPVGRLQQSRDLFQWSDVETKIDLSKEGVAKAVTRAEGRTLFYRITAP